MKKSDDSTQLNISKKVTFKREAWAQFIEY